MQASKTLRAGHKPMIHFLGPRAALWKDATHHVGPHPLEPPNLVKHVAEASKSAPASAANASKSNTSSGSLEFSQLAARYRRAPISEVEMEAIESGGATFII